MLFLDDFLEMLEELPAEFRERFTEMRKIDSEVEAGLDQTKRNVQEFFEFGIHLPDEEKQRRFQIFQQQFKHFRTMAEEKVTMAERMQEILEKYLQHLDKEKTHFKYELEADNPGITETIEKRFSDYVESVIAARKERKRRHPSENGSQSGEPSLKLAKFSFDSFPPFGNTPDFSLTDDDLLSPLLPMLSSAMPMTPPTNGTSGRGRKSTNLDSPLMNRKRPSIPSLKSTLSVPASMNGIALSPAVSEKSWSSAANDNHSPNSAMISNPLLSSTAMPNFVGTESRHGRPRKLTSRVQEMFSEAVSRQRRQHPTIHHHEEDDQGSEGEDSDDAHKSWCFCGEASYGDMVCCDNEHCTIQWFHYECIGMTATPKGKWKMSSFYSIFEDEMYKVKKRKVPSEDDLDSLCRLMEEYENTLDEPDKITYLKKAALNTVQYFNQFPALRQLDHMLRLYVIVGKYSANLGAHGIFDHCESKKFFCESFQFHLLWAESHAKQGHAQRFREILELAHKRVKSVPSSSIDTEFRKLASKYLINEDIFPSITDSGLPQNNKQKKSRRISQVALLQDEAHKSKDCRLEGQIGKGKLIIKTEFIDKIGYLPVSFEELINAVYEDNLEVVEMDISCYPTPRDAETIIKFEKPHLTPVAEISEPNSSIEEKRRRIFSPQQLTRENAPAASPVSFRENEYHKAAAVFSDTVNLGAREPQDYTMPVVPQPVEAFEVFEDPDPSVAASPVFIAPKERRPLAELPPKISKKAPFDLDISNIENDNAASPYNFDDEPTLAGQRFGLNNESKPICGIVTSTPAPNAIVTNTITDNDFFSININQQAAPPVEPKAAFGFLKKRKSIRAPDVMSDDSKEAQPKDLTLNSAMAKMTVESNDSENPLERTGIARPIEEITGSINPWDSAVRQKIMARMKTPLNQHEYQTASPRISRNKDIILSGMKFSVIDLVGEGGFAKVFKCMDEETEKMVALKYEVPSCAWEVYICNQVGTRLSQIVTPSAKRTKKCVMEITDAFIYTNSSILINEYLSYGTLLDLSNKFHGGASSQMILFMAIHVATILRDVHACGVIHGDVKPDNIMILGPLDENLEVEEILRTPIIKFIDWGRAIDMSALPKNTSFVGRAGTASFDCPEMMSGKPWNYHTDYFGFVASMNVFIHGKYAKLLQAGRNTMDQSIKRRLPCREVLTDIFDRLLNISCCQDVPNWNDEIKIMTDFFQKEFSAFEWKAAVRQFNQNLPSDN